MLRRVLPRNIQLTSRQFSGLLSASNSLRRRFKCCSRAYHSTGDISDHTRRSKVLRLNTSTEAVRTRERLGAGSAHPAAVLDEFVAEGKASLDVVRECLNKYFSDLQPHTRQTRLAMIHEHPIAKVALQQVWEDNAGWVDLVLNDFQTQFRLCYVVAAEGLDDFIVNWLKIGLPEDVIGTVDAKGQGVWRGRLLRNLVQAHLMLSYDRSADRALQLLFATRNEWELAATAFNQQRRANNGSATSIPPFLSLSFFPACQEISGKLPTGAYPRTSSQLFDRFIATHRQLRGRTLRRNRYDDLTDARLHLFHPSKPDANPVVTYMRRMFGDKSTEEARALLPAEPISSRVVYYHSFKKAVIVARANGNLEDATWLECKVEELFTAVPMMDDAIDGRSNSGGRAERVWTPTAPF